MRERSKALKRNLQSSGGGASSAGTPSRVKALNQLAEIETLESDLRRREDSYARRDADSQNRIRELSDALDRARGSRPDDQDQEADEQNFKEREQQLKSYHREIMENLDVVQDATTQILQDQERDLLRAFKARLFDVQTELDREKSKKDDSAAAWIQRSKQLQAEVDWAKEMADRLERVNKGLFGENNDLKERIKAGEEDRNYLITQLVAVKKDNVRLTQELERTDMEIKELTELKNNPKARARLTSLNSSAGSRTSANSELPTVDKYETNKAKRLEEIKRLKRLLESQQRGLRSLRATYASKLHTRTELQRFLKQCLLDICQQIKVRRGVSATL